MMMGVLGIGLPNKAVSLCRRTPLMREFRRGSEVEVCAQSQFALFLKVDLKYSLRIASELKRRYQSLARRCSTTGLVVDFSYEYSV